MSAGRCEVCGEAIEPGGLSDILDHLRVLHPDIYGDGPERYADGTVVVEVEPGSMSVETMLDMKRANNG